ncbi:uncharacterized protein TRIREDRAFT_103442 [Trichoderma reesei QM6a]|jgi:hypothetical protein|uniref:Predicted protein n=2 Tax=Hypocrea jecorina TaxID=51453 RepID=G0RAI0_HYPJQ|nr:uncharacterized protein TRIREDRAFT_103442 [Trichoderma reesei QM6a]EGR51602.1 predicted protein [Trichoderma reesei QM6a]ETR96763.1 hypothetical protein M419DRAFT_93354 [Trichoderma reesei RUT C-30]
MASSANPSALHPFQAAAIANIKAQALQLRPDALANISHILRMSNIPITKLDDIRKTIVQHARVALHFHPDRPSRSGRTVVESLLEDGTYRNQFETGISNGLVATQLGGARDEWERSLFSGAYHGFTRDPNTVDAFDLSLRPKYGALDLMRNSDGPAPRFGSCYFLLRPEVSSRSTFTFGGSQAAPKDRGTIDEFDAILAALLEECFTWDAALGVQNVRPKQMVDYINALRESPLVGEHYKRIPSRNLDHLIEAQIHGDVLLSRDVEALVVDPSFFSRGDTGPLLRALGETYGFPVFVHHGFQLSIDDVPDDFRGPTMPSLAARIAFEGGVDVQVVGEAVRDAVSGGQLLRDRGTLAEVLQELKLLWHVLVRYG